MYCIVHSSVDRYLYSHIFTQIEIYSKSIISAYYHHRSCFPVSCCICSYFSVFCYWFNWTLLLSCLRNTCVIFFASHFLILYCLLPKILMSIFSILTALNIHLIRYVLPKNIYMLRHRENQFCKWREINNEYLRFTFYINLIASKGFRIIETILSYIFMST
jgi:hypothetical protein